MRTTNVFENFEKKSILLLITLNLVFTASAFTEDKITGTWTNEKKGDVLYLHEYDNSKPTELDANTLRWEFKVLASNDSGGGVGRYIYHNTRKQKHRIPVQLTPLQRKDKANEGTIYEAVGVFSFYSDEGAVFITRMSLLTQGNIGHCFIGKDDLLRDSFF